MTYFNDKQKVKEYIKMCEGIDGKELVIDINYYSEEEDKDSIYIILKKYS